MGHAIPKIHWNIIETIGDLVDTSTTIDNIPDTSEIEVGMFVTGSVIPDGATVVSKTSTSVELSIAATGDATEDTLEFFKILEFEFPPIEKRGEILKPQERRSVALSGQTQISIDHIEAERNMIFSHLQNTLYESFKTFYDTWAVYGETFKYFDDKTSANFETYELKNFDWVPEKIASRGTNYVWAVPLQIRRVI